MHRQFARCSMVKSVSQASFLERLPHRPYCTDDPAQGLLIRSQATALAYRHIQHNPPPHVGTLVFDVDRADGYHAWRMPICLLRTGSASTCATAMPILAISWPPQLPVPVPPSKSPCAISPPSNTCWRVDWGRTWGTQALSPKTPHTVIGGLFGTPSSPIHSTT